jgi:hypothetical protein
MFFTFTAEPTLGAMRSSWAAHGIRRRDSRSMIVPTSRRLTHGCYARWIYERRTGDPAPVVADAGLLPLYFRQKPHTFEHAQGGAAKIDGVPARPHCRRALHNGWLKSITAIESTRHHPHHSEDRAKVPSSGNIPVAAAYPAASGFLPHLNSARRSRKTPAYSNFGIGVDRKNAAKWRFPQENGTFRCSQEVYVYSEIALRAEPKALCSRIGEPLRAPHGALKGDR